MKPKDKNEAKLWKGIRSKKWRAIKNPGNIFTLFFLSIFSIPLYLFFHFADEFSKADSLLSNFYLYFLGASPIQNSQKSVFNCPKIDWAPSSVPVKCSRWWGIGIIQVNPSMEEVKGWTKLCVLQSKRQGRSDSRQKEWKRLHIRKHRK